MTNKKRILTLAGDGIGPEIMTEALKVIKIIEQKKSLKFEITEGLMGGMAIDKTGFALPPETITQLKEADAVLLAAIGGPKWENLPQNQKPEAGLLALRKELEAFANLRPAKVFSCLADSSSLKREIIEGIDILVVRELTGGIYFGLPRGEVKNTKEKTYANTAVYSESEIRRIVVCACKEAMKRKKKLCSVDKANVLEVSQFWRDITIEIIKNDYPDVELSHMYVDNAAMQLIRNPKQFDVIVTSNLFGDIISDEASMLTGSIGLLPSASLGNGSKAGIFEPIHGSAPDIAGTGKANPIAMILSVSMLLENFGLINEAKAIEKAVELTLNNGHRTADIAQAGEKTLNTTEMGNIICKNLTDSL